MVYIFLESTGSVGRALTGDRRVASWWYHCVVSLSMTHYLLLTWMQSINRNKISGLHI